MAYITERSKDDHTFLPKSNYFKVKGWFDQSRWNILLSDYSTTYCNISNGYKIIRTFQRVKQWFN